MKHMVSMFAVAALSVFPARAAEAASINVTLWNKNNGTMGIMLDKASVPSGSVEFSINNSSTDIMHEFLIAPWNGALASLPYNNDKSQAAEDKIPHIEGQEDMKPGLKTALLLDLAPGSYIVFCNQPGHYKMGMYARLNVTSN
mgnify:CR=1 FL=1